MLRLVFIANFMSFLISQFTYGLCRDAKVEELRVTRNKLCDMLGIPYPVLKSSATKSVVNRKADELESYKDLVTRDY